MSQSDIYHARTSPPHPPCADDAAPGGSQPRGKPAEFILAIRSEPSDVPVANRLRTAMKDLLRRHSLRCTDIREVKATEWPAKQAKPAAAGEETR